FGDVHLQTHRLDAFDEGFVIRFVARPPRFEGFFLDDHEAFANGVHRGGAGGVVILAAGVEAVEELEVEIERLYGSPARLHAIPGAGRDGDGREAGRAAEAFLRATVGDVDAVLVDQHGHAAERGDAVGDHQRVDFVCGFADGLGLVVHAGGSFGLHEGDDA